MAIATIVGSGFMGTALAWPLSDNGHKVRLVGTHLDAGIIRSCLENGFHPKLRRRLPANVQPCFVEQLGEALAGADLLVSGVNSLGVHWIGRVLGHHLWPGASVIAVTKGLEARPDGNPSILPDVLAAELPTSWRNRVSLAAIAGPCIAVRTRFEGDGERLEAGGPDQLQPDSLGMKCNAQTDCHLRRTEAAHLRRAAPADHRSRLGQLTWSRAGRSRA